MTRRPVLFVKSVVWPERANSLLSGGYPPVTNAPEPTVYGRSESEIFYFYSGTKCPKSFN
jgi:hypothetical protein